MDMSYIRILQINAAKARYSVTACVLTAPFVAQILGLRQGDDGKNGVG